MLIDQTQRPAYYEQQFLGADDLNSAIAYAWYQEARHRLGAHTWGVATGLQLMERPQPGGNIDVYILPGLAWDGFARAIVVLQPYKLTEDLFRSLSYDPSLDGGSPAGRLVEIWLRYDEAAGVGPLPGFESCDQANAFSRIAETFRVETGRRDSPADRRAPLSVAGYSVDALDVPALFDPAASPPPRLYDESVPFQSFPPPGTTARWLIPVGMARWLPANAGQPGQFVARSPDDKVESRRRIRYIGAVTETIQATDGILRLKDRRSAEGMAKQAAGVPDDLVWIEGDLRVVGDAKLFGGRLDLRDGDGADSAAPTQVRRERYAVGGLQKTDVRVVIGQSHDGNNRLAVGPLDGTAFKPVLSVRDNNGLEIGGDDDTPGIGQPYLDFHFQGLTQDYNARLINDADGRLSVLAGTLYLSGKLGVGTTDPKTALNLPEQGLQIGASGTASDNFHLVSDLNGPRGLRLYNGNYGAGTHLLTVLPGGAVGLGTTGPDPGLKLDIQGDFGRRNNTATLYLWGSRVGDVGGGVLFLRSGGGVIAMDEADDRVGIGTITPREKLEVNGEVRLGANGNLFAPGGAENLRVIRGSVDPGGSIVSGAGFQVVHAAAGMYRILFDPAFPSRPSASVTQVFPHSGGNAIADGDVSFNHGDTRDNAVINRLTAAEVGVVTGDSAGSASNRAFTFIVIGPR